MQCTHVSWRNTWCVLCMCVNRSVYLYVREYLVHCMCVNMFLCLVCVCALYIVHVHEQVCVLLYVCVSVLGESTLPSTLPRACCQASVAPSPWGWVWLPLCRLTPPFTEALALAGASGTICRTDGPPASWPGEPCSLSCPPPGGLVTSQCSCQEPLLSMGLHRGPCFIFASCHPTPCVVTQSHSPQWAGQTL